jgi:hypothetical protein
MNPQAPDLRSVPASNRGELLVRHYVERWEDSPSGDALVFLLRTAVTNDAVTDQPQATFNDLIIQPVPALGDDRADQRSALIGTRLLGLALCRYVLHLEPLASLSIDTSSPESRQPYRCSSHHPRRRAPKLRRHLPFCGCGSGFLPDRRLKADIGAQRHGPVQESDPRSLPETRPEPMSGLMWSTSAEHTRTNPSHGLNAAAARIASPNSKSARSERRRAVWREVREIKLVCLKTWYSSTLKTLAAQTKSAV